MKFIWCDTETTGLKPENAAPFQIAFIFVYSGKVNDRLIKEETERVFYLNPFDIPGIEYNEEAAKVHGYSKEKIESFEPSKIVCARIDEFLNTMSNFHEKEQMFFCGYNCKFDYDHIASLFNHHNLDFSKYFNPHLLDVFEQVKNASSAKVLPYLENRKLTTVAKFLGVNLENAHDALGDITATREVAKSLSQKGINLK